MNLIQNIRGLYTPIQPSIKRENKDVSYTEFLPHQHLQSFIYCYWELKTQQKLAAPFIYRVVTDGCIDVFFELSGGAAENFVMGFCRKYTQFPLDNSFHYIGIRFLPTAFPQIFKVNAASLSNQFQALKNVNPVFANALAGSFNQKMVATQITKILDELLLETISGIDFNEDPRLYDAIDIILEKYGVVNLETDLNTGISQRQLRRLFKYYIGDTPKSFSKVVRFQNILKAKPSTQSLRKNRLFYNLGYYDQAHFIKEFRNFYGVTPSKAFGRG